MRDLNPIPFDNVQYCRLLAANYKFIEFRATGKEIETGEDTYKRELVLVAYKSEPLQVPQATRLHYVAPIDDPEVKELADGPHDYVVYIETARV